MKKWINNLSFALWMTAVMATGTAFAQTPGAAVSAASVATTASLPIRFHPRHDAAQDVAAILAIDIAQCKQLQSQGTSELEAGNGYAKPKVLAFLGQHASGTDK